MQERTLRSRSFVNTDISNRLLENSSYVLRQAHHEWEILIVSMLSSLILRLSKDVQRVFQQAATVD